MNVDLSSARVRVGARAGLRVAVRYIGVVDKSRIY